jgi:hypothetical protein
MAQRSTLTVKQRKFISAYIANSGNGTQAALASYNTKDPIVAARIASENVRKPDIRAALEIAFEQQGINESRVVRCVREAMDATRPQTVQRIDAEGNVSDETAAVPDHSVRLQAVDRWAKFVGAYEGGPVKKHQHQHAHLHVLRQLTNEELEAVADGKLSPTEAERRLALRQAEHGALSIETGEIPQAGE